MAIEIVDFPIKNGDFPVRYVKLPEGKWWSGPSEKQSPQNVSLGPRRSMSSGSWREIDGSTQANHNTIDAA